MPSTSSDAMEEPSSSKPSVPKLTTIENNSVEIKYNADDWFCFICEENLVEDMVQCFNCKKGAHTSCAGKGKKLKKYTCENCL